MMKTHPETSNSSSSKSRKVSSGTGSAHSHGLFAADFEPSNLVELLRWRAALRPDFPAYTFLPDAEGEDVCLTYNQLDRKARAIGAWLQSAGAEGRRVLVLYPPGVDYLAALFGCLYAGALAVPAYPPRRNRN